MSTVTQRTPFPLQWPEGWKRAQWRKTPKFLARFAQDRDSVIHQLKRRGASHIVITSDLPTRGDGLPYANARCTDPGIAVWWIERGHEHVIACDRWKTVDQNLRAVEMSLEALRALDRWGASETVEKAFAGFAALPPGNGHYPEAPPPQPKKTWREVFGVDPALERAMGPFEKGSPTALDLLAIVKSRHRAAIAKAHPDAGGSHELAAELNAALAIAEQELADG